MRHRSAVLLLVLAVAGCGGGGGDDGVDLRAPATTESEGTPTSVAAIPGDRRSHGAEVALTAGCLACHRLGEAGNEGPGPDLTRIGARMPAKAIERTLLDPDPPMPAFDDLPRTEREALVRYLARLR